MVEITGRHDLGFLVGQSIQATTLRLYATGVRQLLHTVDRTSTKDKTKSWKSISKKQESTYFPKSYAITGNVGQTIKCMHTQSTPNEIANVFIREAHSPTDPEAPILRFRNRTNKFRMIFKAIAAINEVTFEGIIKNTCPDLLRESSAIKAIAE